jgi:YVTN family beta-propeller protein
MNSLRTSVVFVFLALLATGCGEESVRYPSVLDGGWQPSRASRWALPDGGAAGYAYVTNSLMNSVSILDLAARRTIATIPVGVVPLAENGPHHLAVVPRDNALYMPLSFPPPSVPTGPHAAHGSSMRPGVFIKRALDDFRLLGRVDIDPNPGEMVVSPDGRRAFVSHFDLLRAQAYPNDRAMQRSNLIVIDTRTMEREFSVPLCVAAHGMVVAPDGQTLYAACYGEDALAVVSLTGARPEVTLVPIRDQLAPNPTAPSYGPYAVTASPDGRTVWVGCSALGGSRGLFVAFDTASRRFDLTRATTSLQGTPMFGAYAPDGASVLVPLQGRDAIVRLTTTVPLRVLDQRAMTADSCVLPHVISRGPDGLYYLVCEGRHDRLREEPGTVLALHPDTLDTVAVYQVGEFPDAIVFTEPTR